MKNKYLESISVKYENEIDKKQQLKARIENRFIKKPKGIITIKVGKFTKLSVEYMFGGKYSLKKRTKGIESSLGMLLDINKLVSKITEEKTKQSPK